MALKPPDYAQAQHFLDLLDADADFRTILSGVTDGFTFQTFDDVKSRKDRTLARIFHGRFDLYADTLRGLNARKAGVFVTINETDMQGRLLENISRIRAIWVEDDEGLNIPLPDGIEPHIVTETSPGKYHKIILVKGLSKDQHQQVQQTLVDFYGSDPNAKDLARVLRLPGFYHCKGDPFRVRIIHESGRAAYAVDEILKAFPPVESAPRRPLPTASAPPTNPDEPDYIPISMSDPLPDINVDNAAQYLPPPETITNRSEWRDVGLALHHQFQGSDEGLLLYDTWSQEVYGYEGFDDVETTWLTFGRRTTGPTLTFKSLIQAHSKRTEIKKKTEAETALEKGQQLLSECTDYLLLTGDVAPKLNRLANKNVSLEKAFIAGLQQRYAQLCPGQQLQKSEAVRAMRVVPAAPRAVPTQEDTVGLDDPATPWWARDWVWVSESEVFRHVKTGVKLTTRGFSAHFNSFLPDGENAPTDAAAFLRDENLIPKVMRELYMPKFGPLFQMYGVDYVNSFSNHYFAKVPETVQNPDAVQAFRRHIEMVCGGWNREAHIFCNWLRACTELQPQKVRWAVILVGVPGDGKTIFAEFVQAAIGVHNCRAIAPGLIIATANTGQAGWAEGHCFGFLDELKLHGHNRHDAMNALKVYVTNDIVPVRKLFKEGISSPNTANYFIPSNYRDCAPIEEGDRRYFILQSQLSLKTLSRNYFTQLFRYVKNNTGDILHWLRSLPDHEEFSLDGTAPMTEAKRNMIALTADDTAEEIQEIIDDAVEWAYDREVILFDPLHKHLRATGRFDFEGPKRLATILVQLGYSKLGRARIKGERHALWGKRINGHDITLDYAKEVAEKRLEKAIESGAIII